MKRWIAMLLLLCVLLSSFPVLAGAQGEGETMPLTPEDYALTDALWERIREAEDALASKKASQKQRVEAVIALVEDSANYVKGSLQRHEDCFT